MNTVTKSWRVPPEASGQTVRDFLQKRADFSRQLIKRVKTAESIYVNHEPASLKQKVDSKAVVTVYFPEEVRGERMTPEEGALAIRYEDEDVIVLDKPSSVPVVPSSHHEGSSIATRLLHHYDKHSLSNTVHIVTRLDRETSGLMLAAKHAYSHRLLTFGKSRVDRFYTALVKGRLEGEGVIETPISRKPGSIVERTTCADGKPSKTLYTVLESDEQHTLVRLKLETGRTHQIRVHMASIGHPLVGDTLYGETEDLPWSGQALHCHELAFDHPWTGEPMSFTSGIPEEWKRYMMTCKY
ncbi:ribosomal large subunit pseudouridine synthase D [Halobacillus alkaliphilus]|uniref:Pseudouridine synthase n=1 Tax=Halobacillus alkaliphilus TaxID=396056 RepID=A0A1I2L5J7_9BACI|nr:RluA family pseudouridine synthase [Halobacillus alkaliphilus]SFF73828.1 ribosomal large subunit pseudouridine synthase D [Halobacillus alkaliphilus]